jgi:hypothetical protein
MNRLQLAKKIAFHSGMSDSGPVSTVNVSGEEAKIIDWLDMSYRDILALHDDWRFLYGDFTFLTTIGKSEYTPAEAGQSDFKNWITEDVRWWRELPNEHDLIFTEWEIFKRVNLFGSARTQTGQPCEFTVKPDRSIVVWPIPDDTYTIYGNKYKKGLDLTADDSEPIFDSDYHWLIVWRAIVYYGADYVEADKFAFAAGEYKRIKGNMEYNELPTLQRGAPLC